VVSWVEAEVDGDDVPVGRDRLFACL
jgi:hypothetical protein